MRNLISQRGIARWFSRLLTGGFAAFFCALPSLAAIPESEPQPKDDLSPRLEVGMHSDTIFAISADQSGELVLTISVDGTARLWQRSTGRLLRIFRVPLLEKGADSTTKYENDKVTPAKIDPMQGTLAAGQISPDGATVAVGGAAGSIVSSGRRLTSIYFFDARSGEVTRRIGNLDGAVHCIAFSKSGRYVAASFGPRLAVWDVKSGKELGRDESYGDTCAALAWHGDEALATTSADNKIRLYSPLKLGPKMACDLHMTFGSPGSSGGLLPSNIAFSPDGKQLAVSFQAFVTVGILSAKDLHPVQWLDVGEESNGPFLTIQWDSTGKYIAAAGAYETKTADSMPLVARVWQGDDGNRLIKDIPVSKQIVSSLWPLPPTAGGGWLYATGSPSWGTLTASGSLPPKEIGAPPILDFAGMETQFGTTADAASIEFASDKKNTRRILFDLPSRKLAILPGDPTPEAYTSLLEKRNLHRPHTEGFGLTDWKNSDAPKWHGEARHLQFSEFAVSLAGSDDGKLFILGTNMRLICSHANGSNPWQLDIPGQADAINLSDDGRIALVAYANGTVSWLRTADGKPLLHLFIHADERRWVLWTPEGYYDCSPGGDELIGWHMNRTMDLPPDFFSVSRFRKIFYRPDVIDAVVKEFQSKSDLSSTVAVTSADKALGKRVDSFEPTDPNQLAALIRAIAPPVVEFVNGNAAGELPVETNARTLKVQCKVRGTGERPASKMIFRLNGRFLEEQTPPATAEAEERTLNIPPEIEGDLAAFVTVEDQHHQTLTVSEPTILHIKRTHAPDHPTPLPRLFIVSIGVSKRIPGHGFETKDLPQSAADAGRVAQAFAGQRGRVFQTEPGDSSKGTMPEPLLMDTAATFGAIKARMQQVASAADFNDVFVFYFSGHGYIDPKAGYYAETYDTKMGAPLLTGDVLESLLEPIKAHTLVILDTCVSGGAFSGPRPGETINNLKSIGRLANQLSRVEQGTAVITSSGLDPSFQDPDLGGILTQALLAMVAPKKAGSSADPTSRSPLTCNALGNGIANVFGKIAATPGASTTEPAGVTGASSFLHGDMQSIFARKEQFPTFLMPRGVPDFVVAMP